MIITMSGMPGSGKSTIAKRLAEHFGLKRYYMGGIRRQKAAEKGMTLAEYNTYGETHPETDQEVDAYQRRLGETEDGFIIEGRTSYFLIPQALHVFLDVDLSEAAKRIFLHIQNGANRNEGAFQSEGEVLADLERRIASDKKRYRMYYPDQDTFDPDNFDLWLDTTRLSIDEVFQNVVAFIEKKKTQ